MKPMYVRVFDDGRVIVARDMKNPSVYHPRMRTFSKLMDVLKSRHATCLSFNGGIQWFISAKGIGQNEPSKR